METEKILAAVDHTLLHPDSAWEEEYIKGVAIGLLILLILLLIIFFVGNQRRGHYEAG